MPAASALPEPIAALARCQAIELSDTRWDYDFGQLVRAIAELTGMSPARRRLLHWAAAGAVGALLIGGAAWLLAGPGTADLAGRWDLPNGSWWVVVQDGAHIEIEEVYHESREVWLRGNGRIDGDRVEVTLDAVFERKGGASGELEIAPGGDVLRGTLTMQPRGFTRRMLLTRGR